MIAGAKLSILISSGGRRVGLAKCLRESLTEAGCDGRIIGIDATEHSSIAYFTDAFYKVPHCTDDTFIPVVKQICKRENVKLIIPAIDTELPIYAAVREEFQALGVGIAVSAPETVAISGNKTLTHSWLTSHGFPVPRQSTLSSVLANLSEWPLPLILKPNSGSASIGIHVLRSLQDVEAAARSSDNVIVQELITGREHTINVFVNTAGRCICAVPHIRMEVRAGEVSKARTVKDQALMQLAGQVVELLPGAYGPLNVQCFVTSDGSLRIIEMNARFGGGYPLAHRAGAKMTRWLIDEALGCGPTSYYDSWEDELLMLRYDEAVFSAKSASHDEKTCAAMPGSL